MDKNLNRREFLQNSMMASAGLAIPSTQNLPNLVKKENLKSSLNIGFIGVGLRGQSHIGLTLDREDCRVAAICDIDDEMLSRTQNLIKKKNHT